MSDLDDSIFLKFTAVSPFKSANGKAEAFFSEGAFGLDEDVVTFLRELADAIENECAYGYLIHRRDSVHLACGEEGDFVSPEEMMEATKLVNEL